MVIASGSMALWPRAIPLAMTSILLARLCVALKTPPTLSHALMAAYVSIGVAKTIMDGLIGEIRAQTVPGWIQLAWPWRHVSPSMQILTVTFEHVHFSMF